MKKLALGLSLAALAAVSSPAFAADMDRDIGLIVSGVVDKWAGVQAIESGMPFRGVGNDTVFANGGEGRLSLPLGSNLSIQNDIKYEYNSYALEASNSNDVEGPRYSFLGAAHISWRDPSTALIGAFGGAGTAARTFVQHDLAFVGGEAQFYLDNITFYAQGGYIDFNNTTSSGTGLELTDGLFARGVLRWFLDNGSRLELEGSYLSADYFNAARFGDMEAFQVGARYDFDLNLPVAGSTPLFVAYRGTFRDNCSPSFGDTDDHTFMIGTSYSFSGDRITVDRRGATLDTPDFNYGCGSRVN